VTLPSGQAIISGLPGNEEIIANKGSVKIAKTEHLGTSPDLSGKPCRFKRSMQHSVIGSSDDIFQKRLISWAASVKPNQDGVSFELMPASGFSLLNSAK
jgi:hypothetical protein